MFSRTLLLAVLASPMFVPVSCTTLMLPAARGFSQLDVRDLAAGEPAQASPLLVPLVDRTWPATALPVATDEVPEMLRRWPGLSAQLPASGATALPDDESLSWRVLADDGDGDGQLIELQRHGGRQTLTLRYRATDSGVVPLTSRLFSLLHAVAGFVVAMIAAIALQRWMRRVQRRQPVSPWARYRRPAE